jgi:hypothetical protein
MPFAVSWQTSVILQTEHMKSVSLSIFSEVKPASTARAAQS